MKKIIFSLYFAITLLCTKSHCADASATSTSVPAQPSNAQPNEFPPAQERSLASSNESSSSFDFSQYETECVNKKASPNLSVFCSNSENWQRYSQIKKLKTDASRSTISNDESRTNTAPATTLTNSNKDTSATSTNAPAQPSITGKNLEDLLRSQISLLEEQIQRQQSLIQKFNETGGDSSQIEQGLEASRKKLNELRTALQSTPAETFALGTAPSGSPLEVSSVEAPAVATQKASAQGTDASSRSRESSAASPQTAPLITKKLPHRQNRQTHLPI